MRSLPRAWKKCLIRTKNLTVQRFRCFAWTNSRFSWSTKQGLRSSQRFITVSAWITSTSVLERNIFMFTEPLSGWRKVAVRERKTKVDWAIEMARLLEGRYARCQKVIVVCDNLNTHTRGAFYEALTGK